MDEERLVDLQESVERMRILDDMVKTKGWRYMQECFGNLRKGYRRMLLEARNIEEMYKAQCAIKSLNVILTDSENDVESDVDRMIREGKEAAEELKTLKDES